LYLQSFTDGFPLVVAEYRLARDTPDRVTAEVAASASRMGRRTADSLLLDQ